jgi:hypothetical protein
MMTFSEKDLPSALLVAHMNPEMAQGLSKYKFSSIWAPFGIDFSDFLDRCGCPSQGNALKNVKHFVLRCKAAQLGKPYKGNAEKKVAR